MAVYSLFFVLFLMGLFMLQMKSLKSLCFSKKDNIIFYLFVCFWLFWMIYMSSGFFTAYAMGACVTKTRTLVDNFVFGWEWQPQDDAVPIMISPELMPLVSEFVSGNSIKDFCTGPYYTHFTSLSPFNMDAIVQLSDRNGDFVKFCGPLNITACNSIVMTCYDMEQTCLKIAPMKMDLEAAQTIAKDISRYFFVDHTSIELGKQHVSIYYQPYNKVMVCGVTDFFNTSMDNGIDKFMGRYLDSELFFLDYSLDEIILPVSGPLPLSDSPFPHAYFPKLSNFLSMNTYKPSSTATTSL